MFSAFNCNSPCSKSGSNQFLLKKDDSDTIVGDKTEEKDKEGLKKERFYICVFCKNIITSPKESIEINGHHYHVYKNPAGIIFQVGCFSRARGCISIGEPTREFTWFPRFSWNYAACSSCLSHLGWHYTSNGSSFYGLIMDKLAENI